VPGLCRCASLLRQSWIFLHSGQDNPVGTDGAVFPRLRISGKPSRKFARPVTGHRIITDNGSMSLSIIERPVRLFTLASVKITYGWFNRDSRISGMHVPPACRRGSWLTRTPFDVEHRLAPAKNRGGGLPAKGGPSRSVERHYPQERLDRIGKRFRYLAFPAEHHRSYPSQ